MRSCLKSYYGNNQHETGTCLSAPRKEKCGSLKIEWNWKLAEFIREYEKEILMCEKKAYVLLPVVNSYVNTSIRIISLSLARKPRGLTVIEFLLFIFFYG